MTCHVAHALVVKGNLVVGHAFMLYGRLFLIEK